MSKDRPCLKAIQIAHDILHSLADGEIDIKADETTMTAAHAAHDALSWVLGFDCGEECIKNVEAVRTAAEKRGYQLQPVQPDRTSNPPAIYLHLWGRNNEE